MTASVNRAQQQLHIHAPAPHWSEGALDCGLLLGQLVNKGVNICLRKPHAPVNLAGLNQTSLDKASNLAYADVKLSGNVWDFQKLLSHAGRLTSCDRPLKRSPGSQARMEAMREIMPESGLLMPCSQRCTVKGLTPRSEASCFWVLLDAWRHNSRPGKVDMFTSPPEEKLSSCDVNVNG